MKLLNITLLALSVAISSALVLPGEDNAPQKDVIAIESAMALPVEDGTLEKRATIQWPQHNIFCGNTLFTPNQVQAAVNKALSLEGSGGQRGGYPKIFWNRERISLHPLCTGPFKEYPILPRGIYDGGNPLQHRVIYQTVVPGVLGGFCGVITHEGMPGNSVRGCIPPF